MDDDDDDVGIIDVPVDDTESTGRPGLRGGLVFFSFSFDLIFFDLF